MFQGKMGMRNIDIPGARIADTVATTFTPPSTLDRPVSTMAINHRSPPTAGERMPSDSGALPVQPKEAAPSAVRNPATMVRPPSRYSQ